MMLTVLVLVVPAFSQPEKGASEIGLNGAVIIPHVAPSDATGLIDLSYGYYFRTHDLVGLDSISVLSQNVQDVYVLGRYRHLFSTGNPMIFPFVGAGGGVNVLASSGSPTSHWALGSGEAGVKFFVSQRAAFDVAYDLFYVNINGASFSQASFSAVTFGFTYTFGGKKNVTATQASAPPSSAAPVKKHAQTEAARPENSSVAPKLPSAEASHRWDAATQVDILGLAVVSRGSEGAEIVQVLHGSVAEGAGLHAGDVINGVDGKTIGTPAELAAALSEKTAGAKVRLAFLVRGYWQSETNMVLDNKQ